MNKWKTKAMMETDTPIYVNNTQIENIESYIYPGQRYTTKDKEIERRIVAGWTAFAKHRDIFKSNIGTCLKKQIFNSCVLPAMTYGAETWAVTTHAKNKPHKQRWKRHIRTTIKHLGKRKDQGHRRD